MARKGQMLMTRNKIGGKAPEASGEN
jgi:hypothetical protein